METDAFWPPNYIWNQSFCVWTDNVASITFPSSYKLSHLNMIGKPSPAVERDKRTKIRAQLVVWPAYIAVWNQRRQINGKPMGIEANFVFGLFFSSSLFQLVETDCHHFHIICPKLTHRVRRKAAAGPAGAQTGSLMESGDVRRNSFAGWHTPVASPQHKSCERDAAELLRRDCRGGGTVWVHLISAGEKMQRWPCHVSVEINQLCWMHSMHTCAHTHMGNVKASERAPYAEVHMETL